MSPAANSGSTIIVNASQALPPYRSKEGEIGYKLKMQKLNFSATLFRIDRPFASYVTGVVNSSLRKPVGNSELHAARDHRHAAELWRRGHALGQNLSKPDDHGRLGRAGSNTYGYRDCRHQQQAFRRHARLTRAIFLANTITGIEGRVPEFRLAACRTPPDG